MLPAASQVKGLVRGSGDCGRGTSFFGSCDYRMCLLGMWSDCPRSGTSQAFRQNSALCLAKQGVPERGVELQRKGRRLHKHSVMFPPRLISAPEWAASLSLNSTTPPKKRMAGFCHSEACRQSCLDRTSLWRFHTASILTLPHSPVSSGSIVNFER